MSSYTFVTNISDIYAFQKYIAATLPTLQNVTQDTDKNTCTLTFASTLSAGNLTTLQSLLASYNNVVTVEYVPQILTIFKTQIYATTYTRAYSWQYYGTKYRNLGKVVVFSHLEPQKTSDTVDINFSYTFRLVNVTANTVLGTGTFTNSVDAYNTLTITNNSTDESTIELQVKKTGSVGLFVEITAITFFTRST